MAEASALRTSDHRRDIAGLTYVYPVMSRRAGGLSVGINLNPNNACNWRCIYCQVPGLQRGAAPAIDLARLRGELGGFLREVLAGDFFQRMNVPPETRVIRDLAFSGNGEATSAEGFDSIVQAVIDEMQAAALGPEIKLRLITNGSLVRRRRVQAGLERMSRHNGEVWFKLDSATAEGIRRINGASLSPARVRANLAAAAAACPTWVQTCVFALDGAAPGATERTAYLAFLERALADGVPLRGVLLYGIARPSMQPEAPRLSRLPGEWLEAFAGEIRALGLAVVATP